MNNDNNALDSEYTVEALEARFEMEAVVDDGGAETDGSCECKVEW